MIDQTIVKKIQEAVKKYEPAMIQFMKDICAIPSFESKIGGVVKRINDEMKKLGFDEVFVDKMGNSVGRVGNGPKKIVFDSHIDTVGIADPTQWKWDPFKGKVENGILCSGCLR